MRAPASLLRLDAVSPGFGRVDRGGVGAAPVAPPGAVVRRCGPLAVRLGPGGCLGAAALWGLL